ncbi:hypothetical protein ACJJTC_004038, partial [Scirpophaga incertulas]
ERGGVYSVGAADRVRHCGGGVLAIRQLLVAGARGLDGRMTRGGGRVHARVAPAVRARPGQPGGRGLAVAGATTTAASAGAAESLSWQLPPSPVPDSPTTALLTRAHAGLLSPA